MIVIGPVSLLPVTVTDVVLKLVTFVVAKPLVLTTTGVNKNAVGNVYVAVPLRLLQ